jgi:poly(A) polymerase Pap1
MVKLMIVGSAKRLISIFTSVFTGVKKDVLSGLVSSSIICAMVLLSQLAMVNSDAIAAPFGKQIDGIKVDMAIDKVAAVSKDVTKQVGDRTKDIAKDVKEGTKENLNKAKDVTKNATRNLKGEVGDRTDSVLDQTKNLSEKAGEVINSVKDALK